MKMELEVESKDVNSPVKLTKIIILTIFSQPGVCRKCMESILLAKI